MPHGHQGRAVRGGHARHGLHAHVMRGRHLAWPLEGLHHLAYAHGVDPPPCAIGHEHGRVPGDAQLVLRALVVLDVVPFGQVRQLQPGPVSERERVVLLVVGRERAGEFGAHGFLHGPAQVRERPSEDDDLDAREPETVQHGHGPRPPRFAAAGRAPVEHFIGGDLVRAGLRSGVGGVVVPDDRAAVSRHRRPPAGRPRPAPGRPWCR